ncbi:MAG: hypothetical protein P8Y18_06630 [Candidatus Bathyarchaeota archaeon]
MDSEHQLQDMFKGFFVKVAVIVLVTMVLKNVRQVTLAKSASQMAR